MNLLIVDINVLQAVLVIIRTVSFLSFPASFSYLPCKNLYINLRRSCDCLCVSVEAGGRPRLFVSSCCFIYLFWGSVTLSTQTHRHYNESVHRKKHYTRGNNTIPYKLARLVTFESLKWKYSFATNSTLLGSLLYVRCCHRSVKSTAVSNKTFHFQLTNIYLFWGSVTLST